jgi:trans-2,3-dihydro-3-hydroxyanthranilate isomerase
MPRSYRYLHYDVFTGQVFSGNQLAVVLDGRGLSTATMQSIAKEMNFSETTFLLPAERSDTDLKMRIFTPAEELPMAGHPTIGSTFALAQSGVIAAPRDQVVFGLGVGPTPVSLTWSDDELTFAWMSQGLPVFGQAIDDRTGAAAMLGVGEAALGPAACPLQVVSCGLPYVFVPMATRRAVDEAQIVAPAIEAFFVRHALNATGVFLFSTEPAGDGATAYSRMFAPQFGVPEDPATGSASGPLGCYLVRHHVVSNERAGSMLNVQGVRMGRPSSIHISIAVNGDAFSAVRVGGEAVLAGEGTLYL